LNYRHKWQVTHDVSAKMNEIASANSAAQPGFDLGEGTTVMDPEIWNGVDLAPLP